MAQYVYDGAGRQKYCAEFLKIITQNKFIAFDEHDFTLMSQMLSCHLVIYSQLPNGDCQRRTFNEKASGEPLCFFASNKGYRALSSKHIATLEERVKAAAAKKEKTKKSKVLPPKKDGQKSKEDQNKRLPSGSNSASSHGSSSKSENQTSKLHFDSPLLAKQPSNQFEIKKQILLAQIQEDYSTLLDYYTQQEREGMEKANLINMNNYMKQAIAKKLVTSY